MSWFTEFTSKAENMLNKLDENAASILNNNKIQKKDYISINVLPKSDEITKNTNNVQSICTNNLDIKRRNNISDLEDGKSVNRNFRIDLKKDDSSVRVEILQNEIQSLTHEMSLVMHRARVAEQEACDLKTQLEIIKHQNELLQRCKSEKEVYTNTEDLNISEPRDLFKCTNLGAKLEREISTKNESNSVTNQQMDSLRKLSENEMLQENSPDDRTDSKVQALMKSVISKQSALELMAAEKSALEYQLDLLRKKHYEMLNMKNSSVVFNVNDTDDAKAQLPSFLRESPFDTGVARRVKAAYSSIDSFGIKAGMFLRRYPLFRISAFFYVAANQDKDNRQFASSVRNRKYLKKWNPHSSISTVKS